MVRKQLPSWRFSKVSSSIVLVISLVILSINIYGLIWPLDLSKGVSLDQGIPGFNYPLLSNDRLTDYKSMKPFTPTVQNITNINELIFNSIFHLSEYRSYRFYENWFLWTLGKLIYKHLNGIQNSDYLISGRGAWCGQVGEILMTILKQSSIESRFLGLSGHVVLEVNIEGKWIVADPDYGVVYPVGLNELANPEYSHLISSSLRRKGYSNISIDNYIHIFQSYEDNVVLPVGSKLNPRLHIAEIIGAWAKWIIPLILLILGLASLQRNEFKSF